MTRALRIVVARLASLWFTLGCLGLLAATLLASRVADTVIGVFVAIPFALLALNLLAALATSQTLRRQGGLLAFHLALAMLAALAALGQLVGLQGHVEVTEGTAFDRRLVQATAGPFHRDGLGRVQFVQRDFEIGYAPGMKREATVSRVALPNGRGGHHVAEIGDDRPLVVDGYRFYTSFNKGFAPLLHYVDGRGHVVSGAVHLPSYPLNYHRQGNAWALPDGSGTVKLWLHIPEPVFSEETRWQFRKPRHATLVVLDGAERHELREGESMRVGAGLLRYEGVRIWMGYAIWYDPTTPWMVAAALVGALGFAWHVFGRIRGEARRARVPGIGARHAG